MLVLAVEGAGVSEFGFGFEVFLGPSYYVDTGAPKGHPFSYFGGLGPRGCSAIRLEANGCGSAAVFNNSLVLA